MSNYNHIFINLLLLFMFCVIINDKAYGTESKVIGKSSDFTTITLTGYGKDSEYMCIVTRLSTLRPIPQKHIRLFCIGGNYPGVYYMDYEETSGLKMLSGGAAQGMSAERFFSATEAIEKNTHRYISLSFGDPCVGVAFSCDSKLHVIGFWNPYDEGLASSKKYLSEDCIMLVKAIKDYFLSAYCKNINKFNKYDETKCGVSK